jgi:hypothetical protein
LEERRLRVLENRVSRRILGSKRDKTRGEWRNLHDKKLIIRVIKSSRLRWAEHKAHMGGSVYRLLVGKSEGKRPFGRPRTRWEDNIKIYL